MISNLADGGATCRLLKQEDDIAARMLKLRGRVPTTDELVAMVQEKKKKAAVEEVKLAKGLWHIHSACASGHIWNSITCCHILVWFAIFMSRLRCVILPVSFQLFNHLSY